jgi:hypothetical protein
MLVIVLPEFSTALRSNTFLGALQLHPDQPILRYIYAIGDTLNTRKRQRYLVWVKANLHSLAA